MLRRLKRALTLARLARGGHPAAAPVAAALSDAAAGRLTSNERAWIDRLEERRRALEARTDPIWAPRTQGPWEGQPAKVQLPLGEMCRSASKSQFWATLLFSLVRRLAPAQCIELGTAFGLSASYQAAALALNGRGQLVTLDAAPDRADVADEVFRSLGLDNRVRLVLGRFQDILPEVLAEHRPIDYAFVDGHHDERATLAYLEQLVPFLSPGALVVFDDIRWSPGMTRAWRTIEADARMSFAVDLGALGLAVSGGGPRLRAVSVSLR